MNADTYQELAARTLNSEPDFELSEHQHALLLYGLMLGSSAAVLVDYLKKAIFHQHGLDYTELERHLANCQAQLDKFEHEIGPSSTSQALPQISSEKFKFLWCILGLLGEAGEAAENILAEQPQELGKELGDVQWYLAGLATIADLKLSDIMGHNIDKLKKRYPEGFRVEDSRGRKD